MLVAALISTPALALGVTFEQEASSGIEVWLAQASSPSRVEPAAPGETDKSSSRFQLAQFQSPPNLPAAREQAWTEPLMPLAFARADSSDLPLARPSQPGRLAGGADDALHRTPEADPALTERISGPIEHWLAMSPGAQPTRTLALGVDAEAVEAAGPSPAWTRVGGGLLGKERTAAPEPQAALELAQFQLPPSEPTAEGKAAPKALMRRLPYEYGYGSESEISYRKNADLNRAVRDDTLILTPEVNGHVTYRPTDWLETTLEMILEREVPINEPSPVTLPDGEIQSAMPRRFSVLIDQAFVTVRGPIDPFALTVGRKNFEDARHWLYDSSIDMVGVSLSRGTIRAEATMGREALFDGDLGQRQITDRINTYMLHAEYRGIEDVKFAGYVIKRDDRAGREGRPVWVGVRSYGNPSNSFSYWVELAHMRGTDEESRRFNAYAFDVGVTHRFTDHPLYPNVTLGFALASGDHGQNGRNNQEFRQTGLQSNETKFAGISEFRVYGEALDPELSNIKILTLGAGIRPAPNISLDLVYHRYWLFAIADEVRNSALTAQMNQDDTQLSKDIGSAFDVVIGVRNLFGTRRLGMDIRAGWFFPGKAHRFDGGDGRFEDADRGISAIAKFWW